MDQHKELHKIASFALTVLGLSILTSLFAPYHWAADLFSHFYIQYAVGALLLGLWFGLCRKWTRTAISCGFLIYSLIILFSSFPLSAQIENGTDIERQDQFVILHHNRNYGITDHTQLESALNTYTADVAIIQEATQSHVNKAQELLDLYPHQIHEPRINAFGMIALSKCPITRKQIKPFERIAIDNFQMQLTVKCENKPDVTIYAIHPPPPTNKFLNQQRNMELEITAKDISQDTSDNIIMLGDWNITPFSPPFKNVLKTTGLKHEFSTYPPFTTWPSQFVLPFIQIPIDHILYKGNLQLIHKERLPAMGSDHYPVIASFSFTKHD